MAERAEKMTYKPEDLCSNLSAGEVEKGESLPELLSLLFQLTERASGSAQRPWFKIKGD